MILWLATAVMRALDHEMPLVLPLLAGAVLAAWGVVALDRAQERPAFNALAGALAMFIPVVGFAYAAICVVRIRRALA